nr:MAG TPA: hypothetical protein [Caudoviricetes sp.]
MCHLRHFKYSLILGTSQHFKTLFYRFLFLKLHKRHF